MIRPVAFIAAPFALLRIPELELETVSLFAPPRTAACIEAGVAARERMTSLRGRAVDALHKAVPRLVGRARGAAIQLKRSIYNERPLLNSTGWPGVQEELSDGEKLLVADWLDASASYQHNLCAAEEALPAEVESHVRPRLWDGIRRLEFLLPLSLASPALCEHILHAKQRDGSHASKLERSALLYVARSAVKTSPFSTFVRVAAVVPDPDAPPSLVSIDELERAVRSYLSRAAVASIRAAGQRLRVNRSLRAAGENAIELLAPAHLVQHGRLWRTERTSRIKLHPAIVSELCRTRTTFAADDLTRTFRQLGLRPEAADNLVRKLREGGVLVPDDWTDGLDEGSASECDNEGLSQLRKRASGFSRLNPGARIAEGRSIESMFAAEWRAAHGSGAAPHLGLVLENGLFEKAIRTPISGFAEALQDLGAALAPRVRVRPAYAALRQLFIDRFGEKGVCKDVVRFFCEASQSLGSRFAEIMAAKPASPQAPARVPLTVLFQVAGNDRPGAISSNALLVVNRVIAGVGSLTARHAGGPESSQSRLTDCIKQWLKVATHPLEPVDLLVCGECSPLQAHPLLTERVLLWPSEPRLDRPAVLVEDTLLRFDAESALLRMTTHDGDSIAPLHLGGSLPIPAWGPRYWLALLGSPFEVELPGRVMPPTEEVVEEGRVTEGRVVLSRHTWWMSSARMRATWFKRDGAGRLMDIGVDCRRNGIPREIFVRPWLSPSTSGTLDAHKPMWVDTRNPFCTDVLHASADSAAWMILTEALPDARSPWLMCGGRGHGAELLNECVLQLGREAGKT